MVWVSERRPNLPADGLLPVIVQDARTADVLMLAWANAAALSATERTGQAHFWSRSRDELWRKGASSGNVMSIAELATDCDGDAILYRVDPAGPACHAGARSCFDGSSTFGLPDLERTIAARRAANPDTSYTARLLAGGPRRPAEKLVEEAGELASAMLVGTDDEMRNEAADLVYHLLVSLAARGITLAEVEQTLAGRHRP